MLIRTRVLTSRFCTLPMEYIIALLIILQAITIGAFIVMYKGSLCYVGDFISGLSNDQAAEASSVSSKLRASSQQTRLMQVVDQHGIDHVRNCYGLQQSGSFVSLLPRHQAQANL